MLRSVLIAASAMVMWASAPAAADEGEWRFSGRHGAGMFEVMGMGSPEPPVTERQIEHYAAKLGMDDAQLGMAKELYGQYYDAYLVDWLEFAESNADARAAAMARQDWMSMQGDMTSRATSFRESIERRTQNLLDDMRLLLTPEQEDRWRIVERDRRRGELLPKMATTGAAAVDLEATADLLELSAAEREALSPLLEEYAEQIETLLAPYTARAARLDERVDEHEAAQMEMTSFWQNMDDRSPEAMMQISDKTQALQEKVESAQGEVVELALSLHEDAQRIVQAHRRYVERMEEALPPHARAEFRRITSKPVADQNPFNAFAHSRFKIAVTTLENIEQNLDQMEQQLQSLASDDNAFGDMFGGYFTLLRSVEPLSEDQHRRIDEIMSDYESRMESVEDKIAEATGRPVRDEEQTTRMVPTPRGQVMLFRQGAETVLFGGGFFMPGQNELDPALQAERMEVEQEAIDRLRGVLTFYQRAIICQF